MSRPLCAYSKQARYLGSGATTDAANFACVDDGTNDPSLENPARDYLSPLIIQAAAPDALNLRNGGGKVVIVLSTPEGSDTFSQWLPSGAPQCACIDKSIALRASTISGYVHRAF